ncbi:MAG: pyruvate:ferredoxin (flavodoxin) oxidoreductase [Anaerovoracaceae bacterium]|nr:pyruvate:ferredoxin (flavodoxin) oxidoreductase [Anaerovoracaceae bacterium]
MRKLKTMDGNTAAAHVAYAFSEVAAIYPITPSSPMAESMDEWVSQDRRNIFGEKVSIVEMQSEGGAAGAVHGATSAGSYTSTFTASQGLLLMIPNMYKLAGEMAPTVFHVAARAVATHALSIFGDHSDVMGTRQTGFAMLASNSVQQVMDLAAVAHLATIAGKLPTLHFFDGFRTSHEQQKIEIWDYDVLKEMVDWKAVKAFRERALNPAHAKLMGSAEQPETFFQHREACNMAYNETADIFADYMAKINEKLGTDYKPFNYYGAPDATEVLIAMGSVCDAAEEVVDYLNGKGKKVGLIEVHLYRPFSVKYLLPEIPETAKKFAVLDRTKEPGSIGEPLYLDILKAFRGSKFENCFVAGGRYGLGSKDIQPGDILAAFENLWEEQPKEEFTISIVDDVTNLSVAPSEFPDTTPDGTVSCKFWGLGSDGTVGANKNSVKIIGDHTDKKVQAYFQYDSKKSGGITISHLRFGDKAIKSTYYVKQADFVACHQQSYMHRYDIVQDVKPGGYFLLNTTWDEAELEKMIPGNVKRYIANNNIQFYTCNAVELAKEIGLGPTRTNTVLQAGFFKLADIIPIDKATEYMKEAIRNTYGKKGEKIVNMNIAAVDAGIANVKKVDVPESWKTAEGEMCFYEPTGRDSGMTEYLNNIMIPSNAMKGDELPVSTFVDYAAGQIPSGTAAYEKREIATDIPCWIKENCIQCNRCAYVCPHAVIRPFALDEEDAKPIEGEVLKMMGADGKYFTIAISSKDCTGCGSCAAVCPAKNKALEMTPVNNKLMNETQKKFNYVFHETKRVEVPFKESTLKGSQFLQPLLEFSGACPGCGETPYARLITQLFGDRMFIANATGCSSIWGCSAPSTPYTVNSEGKGPAWANSLFEDNAEFGLGMHLAMKARRQEVKSAVEAFAEVAEAKEACTNWIDSMDDGDASKTASAELLNIAKAYADKNEKARFIVDNDELLVKPSVWIFGGDGWAYDIGYGGLDHVIASGEDVNVMVFDTEVYSNTGGQSSKATPMGAVAKFAASGKNVKKKDLAQIAMAYGYVYVAQIAMGADPNQTLKAIREAEAYKGPSIIIAYAPCINHGISMRDSQAITKDAVTVGYWNMLRFNPELAAEGKNPLSVDSKEPVEGFRDFLLSEVRYSSLTRKFPDRAEQLFAKTEEDAKKRYEYLKEQQKTFDNALESK